MGKQLLDQDNFNTTIDQMASKILDRISDLDKLVLVGIRTRGVPLAKRLAASIKKLKSKEVKTGVLDITLYRDDLSQLAEHPVMKGTDITFDINGKEIFLVDDVLYTGRTIRCALDALFDLGRPAHIRLAVMADRLGRELPIQADVVGIHVDTKGNDNVKVLLKEIDGEDQVKIIAKGELK